MQMSISPIKNLQDAFWYLALARNTDTELPIDIVTKKLVQTGIIPPIEHVLAVSRQAVHAALVDSLRDANWVVKQRTIRKQMPSSLQRLLEKAETIQDAFDDICETFVSSGGDGAATISLAIDQKFSDKPEMGKRIHDGFREAIIQFDTLQDLHHDFYELLLALQDILTPMKGRPKKLASYFVSQLGKQWFKLTLRPPTRSYDAINDREAGPFFEYCAAASETVEGAVTIGKLDAAVRSTCNGWRINTQWVNELMDKKQYREPNLRRLFNQE